MDPLTYLTTNATTFGAPEIIFFVAHIALVLAGAYYAFMARASSPLRAELLRLLGYGLLALGVVGSLFAILRLAVGTVWSMPIWFTIVTVLDLALIAYALYYALSVYPARQAAQAQASRSTQRGGGRAQPTLHSSGTNGTPYSSARPIPTTTRRVARRDRKRKGR
jgi:hypothetical protein